MLREAFARAVCAAILPGSAVQLRSPSVKGYGRFRPMAAREGPRELAVRQVVLDQSVSAEQRHEALFRYFLDGFVAHATRGCERVQYRGMPATQGYRINGLEGFARTAPLLAAWIYSGRGTVVSDSSSGVDLVGCLENGILAGTAPKSPVYWGRIRDRDQRIIEAADIARTLWLTRDFIWRDFTAVQRKQVADWLLQVNARAVWPNNWLLSPVVVNFALAALGCESTRADPRYDQFKASYLDHGWYCDGSHGVDYYNAWGITYDLLWIHLLRPDFDRDFIRRALAQSAWLTAHLIGPKGIPILGRSICYRTAIPVPVIANAFIDGSAASLGRGRRALDVVWRHFVAHGCLRNGSLTQGYFDSDPRFVETYLGPGSSHWGLRSLVLALMQARGSDFWTVPEVPLPIEVGDYCLDLPKLGWIVTGRREPGEITIRLPANASTTIVPEPYTKRMQWAEWLARRPLRPRNMEAKYRASEYSSARPFPTIPSR